MRVAVLVPDYAEYSGDARVAEVQVNEFRKKGHTVAIFSLAASIDQKGVDLFVLGMPKNLFFQRIYRLFFPLDLIKLLLWLPKLRNFDLIIAHLYPMTWLASVSSALFKVRYIFWFHGIEDFRLFPRLYERIYMQLHLLLTNLTIKNADSIVSVSNFAKTKLEQFTGLDSQVVYNKIDKKRFHESVDGQKIRNRYKLGDSPVLLFVGRLAPQKGVNLLIEAFKLVRENVPEAKLVLAGDPTFSYYLEELKTMSDDSVIFAGHVSSEDMPYYYGMCDVYTTCSLWENHNLPVLEAQSCGKPVIAFNIEAFKEVITENGLLVEKGNIEAFSKACIKLLKKLLYSQFR